MSFCRLPFVAKCLELCVGYCEELRMRVKPVTWSWAICHCLEEWRMRVSCWESDMREWKLLKVQTILVSMSRDWCRMQDLSLHGTKPKCTYVVKAHDTCLFCLIQLLKLFHLLMPHYFCFGNRWVFDPIFLEFFCSMWFSLTCLKI